MSKKYIPIETVDDIDLHKITIANINDRYIDRKGNRFATRFNMRTKKIQIVRIALGMEEANKAKGKVIHGLVRKKASPQTEEAKPEEVAHAGSESADDLVAPDLLDISSDLIIEDKEPIKGSDIGPSKRKALPEWIVAEGIEAAENTNIGDFLAVLDENYTLLAERLFGIINNIKNSGIMTQIAEIDDAIDYTNIFDHKISPKMEEAKKYNVEFAKHPENPDHYIVTIEKPFRMYLHDLAEPDVMEFLRAYFLGSSCLGVLEETLYFVQQVFEKTKAADTSSFNDSQKQFLEYAYSTCDFLTAYIREDAAKILHWMKKEKIF